MPAVAAVVRDAGRRRLQHLEAAVLFAQLLQEDDVEDDPADGQQARETTGTAASRVDRAMLRNGA
jgi:hypothetical protein